MSDTKIDFVVKFGGSAVTDKNNLETLRPESLSQLAKIIQICHEAGQICIVVHGAGSFGHYQAKQFSLNEGLNSQSTKQDHEQKMWGFALVRQSVLKLNEAVVNSLINVGVPAVSFSPASSWHVKDRQPTEWPHKLLEQYLKHGFVPVFHGDCCLDSNLVCSILSGDTIIKTICSTFTVKKVVFITDVDGIFTQPPQYPDAKLLKSITVDSDGHLKESVVTSDSANDVTGGMKLKMKAAIEIAVQTKGQCPVYITGYNFPQLLDILSHREHSEDWNVTCVRMNCG